MITVSIMNEHNLGENIETSKQTSSHFRVKWLLIAVSLVAIGFLALRWQHVRSSQSLGTFKAQPFNKVHPFIKPHIKPAGLVTPSNIRNAYNLVNTNGGSGTIAIIDAYDYPTAENDLAVFDTQFGLPSCTTANGCFEKHKMTSRLKTSGTWSVEAALDVQWAHAIAPGAKILLVEATSDSGTSLMNAINYARARSDVVAVSMSWGGNEFATETQFEPNFTSSHDATFFAASGDGGHGTSWPAVSANVVSVGGTSLQLDASGNFVAESAWSGSGGGVSTYIAEPSSQTSFGLNQTGGKRAVPDVAYNADPASGYAVYDSTSYFGYRGWFQVGGTSAGTPQWAALRSINSGLTQAKLYQDATANASQYYRDITSGKNGSCGSLCNAGPSYDFVTGLGTPITQTF